MGNAYFKNTYMFWHKEAHCSNRKGSSRCENEYFSVLPPELIVEIFKYLSFPELGKCALVCKRWHKLSMDETLWKTVEIKNKKLHITFLKHVLNCNVRTLILEKIKLEIPFVPVFESSRSCMLEHFTFFVNDHYYSNHENFMTCIENLLLVTSRLKIFSLKVIKHAPLVITPLFLNHLARLKNLERLELSNVYCPYEFGRRDIVERSQKFGSLQHFSFTIHHYDDSEIGLLEELLCFMPYLKTLLLSDVCEVNFSPSATFRAVFFKQLLKMKYLEVLKLPRMKLKSLYDVLYVLERSDGFDKLRSLTLTSMSCEEFIEEFLKLCLNITELVLVSTYFNDAILRNLSNMPCLTKLEIMFCHIPVPLSIPLNKERLFKLQELCLKYGFFHWAVLDTEIMMKVCPNLTKLHLENCCINTEVLKYVNIMDKLRSLSMVEVSGISNSQFYSTVKNHSQLELCSIFLKDVSYY